MPGGQKTATLQRLFARLIDTFFAFNTELKDVDSWRRIPQSPNLHVYHEEAKYGGKTRTVSTATTISHRTSLRCQLEIGKCMRKNDHMYVYQRGKRALRHYYVSFAGTTEISPTMLIRPSSYQDLVENENSSRRRLTTRYPGPEKRLFTTSLPSETEGRTPERAHQGRQRRTKITDRRYYLYSILYVLLDVYLALGVRYGLGVRLRSSSLLFSIQCKFLLRRRSDDVLCVRTAAGGEKRERGDCQRRKGKAAIRHNETNTETRIE